VSARPPVDVTRPVAGRPPDTDTGEHRGASRLAGLSARIARRPGRVIAATGTLCAVAYALSLVLLPKADGRVVVGDAVHYFVYLRSLVFDGDLRFQNEYIRLYRLSTPPPPDTEWVFTPLPTGYTRNVMPIGTAVVWAPLYLLTTAGAWLLHALGLAAPADGFSRPFQASAAFSGIAAATLGAWLAFRMARDLFGPAVALWATLAVWLGSSALYYSLVSPTYSHASSMLVTSLVLYAWWRTIDRRTTSRYAMVGALVGLAALVRLQDVVFLAAPVLDALDDARHSAGNRRRRWGHAGLNAAVASAAAAVAFSPQMFVWSTIYGSALLVPQGSGFMRWSEPHVVEMLFSSFRGLFTWTPVVLVAVAGLLQLGPGRRHLAITLGVIFVLSCYVNAAVADWWAGEAFGARRFVSCFPVFVVGCAAMLDRWRDQPARCASAVALVVALNLLLLFQYQLFLKGWRDVAPYPGDPWNLWIARFVVPVRFLARLVGGG
jgi:hypothetical protein